MDFCDLQLSWLVDTSEEKIKVIIVHPKEQDKSKPKVHFFLLLYVIYLNIVSNLYRMQIK